MLKLVEIIKAATKEIGKFELGFNEFRDSIDWQDRTRESITFSAFDIYIRYMTHFHEIAAIISRVSSRFQQEDYFGAAMDAGIVIVTDESFKILTHYLFKNAELPIKKLKQYFQDKG